MGLIQQKTITDPVNAGDGTAWMDVSGLADLEFLIESTLTQAADFRLEGSYDSGGTNPQTLGGPSAVLALAAGNVTTQEGILSRASFDGWVRVFCDPAADSTGTVTVRLLARQRK